jgi:FKBP-type peptidyl-prolyl cis-trans isomerase
MKRLLLLLATVTLAGCSLDSTGPANNPSDPATETFAASLGVDIPSMVKTEAGDYYKDITVGTGAGPIAGDAYVDFKYDLYLKDGSKFESGTIALADQQSLGTLIPGLADTMQGMREGGRRLMVISSAYAYQNSTRTGATGVVMPPNSTLIFDITLNHIASVQ